MCRGVLMSQRLRCGTGSTSPSPSPHPPPLPQGLTRLQLSCGAGAPLLARLLDLCASLPLLRDLQLEHWKGGLAVRLCACAYASDDAQPLYSYF